MGGDMFYPLDINKLVTEAYQRGLNPTTLYLGRREIAAVKDFCFSPVVGSTGERTYERLFKNADFENADFESGEVKIWQFSIIPVAMDTYAKVH